MGLENTLLVALGILNTTAMTLAISSSLVMKSTKRGHRIYLMIVFTGLIVLSCTSGLLTNDGRYEDLKYGKASSNSKASNSLIDQIRKVGLFILLGPGLATLSFLRLLLLICIVSSSRSRRGLPSNYLSSWYGTALHMGLGPLLGVIRICTLENWINQPQLKATWEGLEAFWDLGCCLIYLCLRIQIQLSLSRKRPSTADMISRPNEPLESASGAPQRSSGTHVNGSNSAEKTRKVINSNKDNQRNSWLLVANDGYLPSTASSVLCRCCILLYPWLEKKFWLHPQPTSAIIFGLIIPGILIVDLRAKMTKCCFKISCKGLTGGNAGAANQSVYVTTAAASAASRVTSHSNLLALTPNAPSQTCQCHPISRSISYTGRCALSSILSAAPEGIGGPGKRPTSGLSKTKTWCGPLDETMINLVGNKYVQACPGGRNEE